MASEGSMAPGDPGNPGNTGNTGDPGAPVDPRNPGDLVSPGDAGAAARAARTNVRVRQLLGAAARLMERDGSHAVSMQALAEEAAVSVGLIYRYFDNKQDLLLAVIMQVLDAFATEVPQAVEAAGTDPVERVAAAFAAYCTVIDEHRYAAVLSYRESKMLGEDGRRRIRALEIKTSGSLRRAVQDAVDAGRFTLVDVDLFADNLLLLAHSWALKHWYFEPSLDFPTYVRKQTALALSAVVAPNHRGEYAHLLDPAVVTNNRPHPQPRQALLRPQPASQGDSP